MSRSMKLADSTIYTDNDLTIPTTRNSIIVAKRKGVLGARSFYVSILSRYTYPCEFCKIWAGNDIEIPLSVDDLEDIVIIYRAPLEGVGPELIEPLEDIYLEETLMKVESFFKRVSDKVVDGIRAVLEAE